jgi:hypothetical protein
MFTHFEQLGYLDFYTLINLLFYRTECVKYHENFKLSGTSKKCLAYHKYHRN